MRLELDSSEPNTAFYVIFNHLFAPLVCGVFLTSQFEILIMERVSLLLISLRLSSCSAGNINCSNQTCAALNGALMVKDIYAQDAPKKCSEMSGDQQKQCLAQVQAIKKSIAQQREH
jgi:hypothetical protein